MRRYNDNVITLLNTRITVGDHHLVLSYNAGNEAILLNF